MCNPDVWATMAINIFVLIILVSSFFSALTFVAWRLAEHFFEEDEDETRGA